jgi:hypothetical protein
MNLIVKLMGNIVAFLVKNYILESIIENETEC